MIGRNFGLLHEMPDQLSIMRGLTKWADRITAPAEAPGLVNEAFRRLLSGRRRPVALECAMDTWGRKAPVVLPAAAAQADPCPVDEDGVERAAKLLGSAKRPMIVVGGGAQGAGEYVAAIAEMLEAPVMTGTHGPGRDRRPASPVGDVARPATASGARPTSCWRSARACSRRR